MVGPVRMVVTLALLAGATSSVRADEIDDWIRSQMRARNVPAVSIAVVRKGVLVRASGYGIADLEHDAPATPDTVYKVGSVSKQFIAAAIMLLVQDGKIALTDAVTRHLPDAPPSWRPITIRHLLTHTSGLIREAPGFDPYKEQPDIDVIKTSFAAPLGASPGAKYVYSNLGYYVLAETIQRVSGQPWPAFLQERIFGPLEMTATRPTSTTALMPGRARGYTWLEKQFRNSPDWLAVRPSGAFVSTVRDLARWEAALQTDRVLTPASKKEMWTPVRLNDGTEYPYGFGWEVDYFPNGIGKTEVPMIRHEGTIPGFRAVYWRLPNHDLTVIVLSNLERAALDQLTAGIAIRYAPELTAAYRRRWPQ